jgi:chromate reductase
LKLLLFAGSLRTGSFNKKLLANANTILSAMPDCQPTVVDIKSLSLPVYDADIEAAGMPEGVKTLGQMVLDANAIVIASPEYNNSISSPLKNTIDWVSRLRPVPWENKPVLLMGTSPGYFGAVRGLIHARNPLEALGCYLYPQNFALPKAAEAFLPTGELADLANKARLEKLLAGYLEFAKKLS